MIQPKVLTFLPIEPELLIQSTSGSSVKARQQVVSEVVVSQPSDAIAPSTPDASAI